METNEQTTTAGCASESRRFDMVAKTFQGLEDILADEIRALPGAQNVETGRRMVSFEGTLETMYRANMQCRTALRILKPIYTFTASDPDELYSRVKEYDWGSLLNLNSTFAIDAGAVYSDDFTNSRYVTYRVKDAIVDWFQDRYGINKRPGVRLQEADVNINIHISGQDVTLSLDSSGESLHKRGYRVAQTEAPINEVLAAGIIMRSGWKGEKPMIDPMCGSGTFLIEAAMIAAGIMPGVYRQHYAFETWPDFNRELFEEIFNDDSAEHTPQHGIYGADISPKAIEVAEQNIKQAGLSKYITLTRQSLAKWEEAPEGGIPGVMFTNPPYGERISVEDMNGLYALIGKKLKEVFKGYEAWIIGYRDEYFNEIGLKPSFRMPVLNGKLECELREYIIFDGSIKSFKNSGGTLTSGARRPVTPKGKSGRNTPDTDRPARKDKKDKKDFKGDRRPQRKNFTPRPKEEPTQEEIERYNENPLARRRNPGALRQIMDRQPSIKPAPDEKPAVVMRSRRGWRKK